MPNLTIYLSDEILKWIETNAKLDNLSNGRYAQRMLIKAMNLFSGGVMKNVQEAIDRFDVLIQRKPIPLFSNEQRSFWIKTLTNKMFASTPSQQNTIRKYVKILKVGHNEKSKCCECGVKIKKGKMYCDPCFQKHRIDAYKDPNG